MSSGGSGAAAGTPGDVVDLPRSPDFWSLTARHRSLSTQSESGPDLTVSQWCSFKWRSAFQDCSLDKLLDVDDWLQKVRDGLRGIIADKVDRLHGEEPHEAKLACKVTFDDAGYSDVTVEDLSLIHI